MKAIYSTYYRLSWGDLESLTYVKVGAKVDQCGLGLFLIVSNKSCCPYQGKDLLFHKDGIEVLIVKKQNLIHKLFVISCEENQYGIVEASHNDNSVYRRKNKKTDFSYKLEVKEKSFSMEIHIPFSSIQVNPKEDTELIFDLGGLISYPNTKKHGNNCKLFNLKDNFFEFNGIGGIRFR